MKLQCFTFKIQFPCFKRFFPCRTGRLLHFQLFWQTVQGNIPGWPRICEALHPMPDIQKNNRNSLMDGQSQIFPAKQFPVSGYLPAASVLRSFLLLKIRTWDICCSVHCIHSYNSCIFSLCFLQSAVQLFPDPRLYLTAITVVLSCLHSPRRCASLHRRSAAIDMFPPLSSTIAWI